MNLQDLGLKSKPATHYFAGGYVSFSTQNKELFYTIMRVTKDYQGTLQHRKVVDKEHLNNLLAIKSVGEALHL